MPLFLGQLTNYVDRRRSKGKLGEDRGPIGQAAQDGGLIQLFRNNDGVARIHDFAVEPVVRPECVVEVLSADHRSIGSNDEDLTPVGVPVGTASRAQVVAGLPVRLVHKRIRIVNGSDNSYG